MKKLTLFLILIVSSISLSSFARESARNSQTSYQNLSFDKVQMFGKKELNDYFKFIRDVKFLEDPEFPDQLRRLTWLYQNDGCHYRAALVSSLLKSFGRREFVEHIFIFGHLNVKTKYASSGEVEWWFHVAPIVKVRNQLFVIDPSINYHHPITLKKWISLQSDHPESLRFAICHGSTIGPDDDCLNGSSSTDVTRKALNAMPRYLMYERKNLKSLGYDDIDFLGSNPPWR